MRVNFVVSSVVLLFMGAQLSALVPFDAELVAPRYDGKNLLTDTLNVRTNGQPFYAFQGPWETSDGSYELTVLTPGELTIVTPEGISTKPGVVGIEGYFAAAKGETYTLSIDIGNFDRSISLPITLFFARDEPSFTIIPDQLAHLTILPDSPDRRRYTLSFTATATMDMTAGFYTESLQNEPYPIASVGNMSVIGVTAKPEDSPKLFAAAVGVNDVYAGSTLRLPGDLDASKMYATLATKPNFAPASLGNPTGPLVVEKETGGAVASIKAILTNMDVRPQDTLVFYFSGHGGYFASGNEPGVLIKGIENTGSEYLQVGKDIWSDDDLVNFFATDAQLRLARKVFILDACYSGGFRPDMLNGLSNWSLLAAASESETALGDENDGHGIFTDEMIQNYLAGSITFRELKESFDTWNSILNEKYAGRQLLVRDSSGDTSVDLFSAFASASDDFDQDQRVTGAVPEPSSIVFLCFGFIGTLSVLRWRMPCTP
jgi:hypothetical protein